jgi:RepB DNA-primase from phage plasmid
VPAFAGTRLKGSDDPDLDLVAAGASPLRYHGGMHPSCDPVAAATFLHALTGTDGFTTPVTFQTLDDRKAGRHDLLRCVYAPLRPLAPMLGALNAAGAGIFVTVNATNGRGRTAAHITSLRALFIDEDVPRTCALKLPPSIVVRSARGAHVYWLLKPEQQLNAFSAAQKQLANVYGTDSTVSDLPRVMRIPGFLHQKGTALPVTLEEVHPDRRYAIEEILAAHPVRRMRRRAIRQSVDLATLDDAGKLDAIGKYIGWVMSRSPAPGRRNILAFQVAAEGLRQGIPLTIIEQMVMDFCAQAGIPEEAASVLRSAIAYHARRVEGAPAI